ncbi:MAG: lipopolysaccharide biosynthesis protein, partial [Porphyromonadaceae bacterium]|nr:lipopolysaccharide biosynthesis protein [Porphyromonadaceae bacterium]
MPSLAAKESILGTLVTYIGVGIGFVTTFFILAKYLTPEEIGLTRLLPELATQLSGLGLLGMTYSLSRYFPFFKDSPTNPYRAEDGPNHGFFYYV